MVIANKLITPDGTVLVSRNRHDFVTYKDKNGKTYMIDGGRDYCRASNNGDEMFIQITTNSPWEVIRDEYTRWNIHSKSYVKLKDISDNWLQNIIDFFIQYRKTGEHFRIYLEEKIYRAENEISVPEEDNYQLDYAA